MSKENRLTARTRYIIGLLNVKKNDRILNIGISNIPEIEMALENKVKECATIDIDDKKLKYASKFLKKAKLINADILKKLPFKERYFDKVVIIEVLEHLEDDNRAVKEIYRVLKSNGIIIAAVPNKHPLHIINPVKYLEHKRHYSNEEIIKLLEINNFRILELNAVEDWTLLANLYIHLFNRFILRQPRKFHIFTRSASRTYERKNKSGLDIIVKARKEL